VSRTIASIVRSAAMASRSSSDPKRLVSLNQAAKLVVAVLRNSDQRATRDIESKVRKRVEYAVEKSRLSERHTARGKFYRLDEFCDWARTTWPEFAAANPQKIAKMRFEMRMPSMRFEMFAYEEDEWPEDRQAFIKVASDLRDRCRQLERELASAREALVKCQASLAGFELAKAERSRNAREAGRLGGRPRK
jgi:hypothetical protein